MNRARAYLLRSARLEHLLGAYLLRAAEYYVVIGFSSRH